MMRVDLLARSRALSPDEVTMSIRAQEPADLALKVETARQNSPPPDLHSMAELFAQQDCTVQ